MLLPAGQYRVRSVKSTSNFQSNNCRQSFDSLCVYMFVQMFMDPLPLSIGSYFFEKKWEKEKNPGSHYYYYYYCLPFHQICVWSDQIAFHVLSCVRSQFCEAISLYFHSIQLYSTHLFLSVLSDIKRNLVDRIAQIRDKVQCSQAIRHLVDQFNISYIFVNFPFYSDQSISIVHV